MGGKQDKPKPAPQPTIDDVILDMRLSAKRFENEAKRCEREKNQMMNKAKQAMAKNNEEEYALGARLYLTSAMNKQKEASNLQKMAHKMDYLQGIIRSSTNQQATMQSLSKITPMLQQQVHQMPLEQVYANMGQFENAMDALMVEGKVMEGVMNQNQDIGQDLAVDQMMGQLKAEIQNDVMQFIIYGQTSNQLNNNNQVLFNELSQPQQGMQQQQQMNPNYK